MKKIFSVLMLSAFALLLGGAEKYSIVVRADRENAKSRVGEKVSFTIDSSAFKGNYNWSLKKDSENPVCHYSGKFKNGTAEVSLLPETPGFVLLSVNLLDANGNVLLDEKNRPVTVYAGAAVSPEQLRTAAAEPADFDAFWGRKTKEALDIPLKYTMKEVEPSKPEFKGRALVYDVKVDCTGNTPVSGYLALPAGAKPKSLPAVLCLHGAGVLSAGKWDKNAVESNAIFFDINAHGIANGESKEFYRSLEDGALKEYWYSGYENGVEGVYFVGMFQRVVKALQFLKSLPEWDGKTLVTAGGSQGGAQALVGAALDQDVTLCASSVTWLSDLSGAQAGRIQPVWGSAFQYLSKNSFWQKVAAYNLGYFDVSNFAKRVKCDAIMSVGFVDVVCPPASVYCAYNNLQSKNKMMIDCVGKGHADKEVYRLTTREMLRRLRPPKYDTKQFRARASKPDAKYKTGDAVEFQIELPGFEGRAKWRIEQDNAPAREGEFAVEPVRPTYTVSETAKNPGFMLLTIELFDRNGREVVLKSVWDLNMSFLAGAAIEPERISGSYEPANFDEFWKEQAGKALAVPLKYTMKEAELGKPENKGKALVYDVRVDCGNIPVSGYLSLPAGAKDKSLPAVLMLHGYGVRSAIRRDAQALEHNAMFLDINVHGIENGRPKDFYEELRKSKLIEYHFFGTESLDNMYLTGIFQRVVKALQFLKSMPEWNGKDLIVCGGSQGGAQALAGAALDKDVNFCVASAPWLGDLNREKMGRLKTGWRFFEPFLHDALKKREMLNTMSYFDSANFAKRISCDAVVSVGYVDSSCQPSSVYLIFNNLKSQNKTMVDCVDCAHWDKALYDPSMELLYQRLKAANAK